MIASIRGKLVEKKTDSCVIESNGFGLEILIPQSTFDVLGSVNSEVFLITYLHVREDALTLFGFSTAEEKQLFKHLLSVSGIGPRLALGILSSGQTVDIYSMISEGLESALVRIPGLGKKTAQRLIVDLKEKARKVLAELPQETRGTTVGENLFHETVLALVSLGYGRIEAEKITDKAATIVREPKSVEDLVRVALTIKI